MPVLRVVEAMNPVNVGLVILLAGGAIATYLWLLVKLAPSQSVSRLRLQAEYGLRQEYPAPEKPIQPTHSIGEGVTTEYA
jgi:hypothetical protein